MHEVLKGFHVTLYQAHFASHHTRHVGFLSSQSGIEKHNKLAKKYEVKCVPRRANRLSYKNNARALFSRILSIVNLDWLQHTCEFNCS